MDLVERLGVVVVEDEGLFRDMLRVALSRDPALEVIADFANGEAALKAVPRLKPHVAILEYRTGCATRNRPLPLMR